METQVQALARYAARARFGDLSADSRQQLPVHILDSLGCCIAALGAPRSRRAGSRSRSSAAANWVAAAAQLVARAYRSAIRRTAEASSGESTISKSASSTPSQNAMSSTERPPSCIRQR